MTTQFRGTGVALITPFTDQNEIDLHALERLVEYTLSGGVDYLVILGTTSEAPTLSFREKELVKQTIMEVCKKRVPLVLGIGGPNTAQIEEDLKAVDTKHYDAILSVTPYYNKPSQEGLFRHYTAVSEASKLPVILYNVPHRTGCNLQPATLKRIAEHCKNVIGIKEAGGDMEQALEMMRLAPKDFLVISGDDTLGLPEVLAGCSGCISVIANGLPSAYSQMLSYGLEKKPTEAYDIFYRIAATIKMIYEEGNPAGIKALLKEKIGCSPRVRLPLVEASEGLQARLKESSKNLS